jgi:hypothetical protein
MKKSALPLLFICSIFFLPACKKSNIGLNSNTTTTTNSTTTTTNGGYSRLSLGGTKWCLYQYKDASMQNPLTRNDTLVFIDSTNYTYNHQPNKYYLNIHNSTGLLTFNLYGTPFADLYGKPAANFITYGEIIDVPFTQVGQFNPLTYSMWMKKI